MILRKFVYTAAMTALCAAVLSGCGSTETESLMGRYTEREIEIPGGYDVMHPLADGGCYLYGGGAALLQITYDGEQTAKTWGWRSTTNINVEMTYAVSDAGEVMIAYFPKWNSDEEYESYAQEGGALHYSYLYVDKQGSKHALQPYGEDYQPDTNFDYFSFAPDGILYGAGEQSGIFQINVETGRADCLFETMQAVREIAFVGDTMVALDQEKAYLYDRMNGRLLEDNSILNEFVASHQNGSKSIVLAVSEEMTGGNISGIESTAGSPILYLACRTGIYRYVWDGSVIEQIADGQFLTLGNSQYKPLALQVLPEEKFRVLFNGSRMLEVYYDETLPSRPEKELVVYSLQEDGRLRYAAQLFSQEHPEVMVTYETGMEGDNAVTKEDALKNLNTRILAGEGPDILVLDGMEIEQYAEKGVLKELDDFLAPYEEEGILYENIVESMRMTEDGRLYSIPLSVHLPVWLSETKYLGGEESLEDIVDGLELARKEHPDGPLLVSPEASDLLGQLMPICLPAWTDEDGSLDIEKIEEFYYAAARLWELDNAGMDESQRQVWQDRFSDWTEENRIFYGASALYWDFGEGDDTLAVICYLQHPFDMSMRHCYYVNFERDGESIKAGADEIAVEICQGQAQNVFWAESIVGICEQTKESELAQEFMELLLSERIMDKWWLNKGIPIRKDSLEASMDITNMEYAQVMGYSETDIYYTYNELIWPDEEDKQWLYQAMEQADCFYQADSMLEEAAAEIGLQILDGTLSPEEGARQVAARMEISMQE